jgi:hypothetical protein
LGARSFFLLRLASRMTTFQGDREKGGFSWDLVGLGRRRERKRAELRKGVSGSFGGWSRSREGQCSTCRCRSFKGETWNGLGGHIRRGGLWQKG